MLYLFYLYKIASVIFSTLFGSVYLMLWGVHFSFPITLFGLPKVFRSRKGFISFGKGVRFNSNYSSNLAGAWHPVSISAIRGGSIRIGNNTGISSSVIISEDSIVIGDNVMIGVGCTVCDTDFHPVDFQERLVPRARGKKAKVIIEDGVFLGMHSIVLKGVTIGARTVVAANSVVTKSLPPDVIAGGCPARVIRKINQLNSPEQTKQQMKVVQDTK